MGVWLKVELLTGIERGDQTRAVNTGAQGFFIAVAPLFLDWLLLNNAITGVVDVIVHCIGGHCAGLATARFDKAPQSHRSLCENPQAPRQLRCGYHWSCAS